MKYTVEYYPYNHIEGEKPSLFFFDSSERMYSFVDTQLKSATKTVGLDFQWLIENTYALSEYRSEAQCDNPFEQTEDIFKNAEITPIKITIKN